MDRANCLACQCTRMLLCYQNGHLPCHRMHMPCATHMHVTADECYQGVVLAVLGLICSFISHACIEVPVHVETLTTAYQAVRFMLHHAYLPDYAIAG